MTINWDFKEQFALICNLHSMYRIPPATSGQFVKQVFADIAWSEVYEIVAQAVSNYDEIYAHLKKEGMVE